MKELFPEFHRSRVWRWLLILGAYSTILICSIWLSYQLRFDFFVERIPRQLEYVPKIPLVMFWVVSLKLVVLFWFRQYRGLVSFFGTPDLYRLGKAVTVASAIIAIIRLQFSSIYIPPRGVILIDFVLSFVMLAGFRTACRVVREVLTKPAGVTGREQAYRIVIVGAGDVGAGLAKDLLNRPGLGRLPVAFVDDDPDKIGNHIHNIPVLGRVECLSDAKSKLKLEEAIIAMPHAPAKRVGEVVHVLQKLHLKFVTVPSLDQMATGKVKLSQLRPVEIQDLLRREPVEIERESIKTIIEGRSVVVTGAGGSIGSELCRQIVSFNPSRLVLLDQSEYLLFEIEQELVEVGFGGIIIPSVCNILDEKRVREVFSRYVPEVVFHAAALKHVPMMELQPSEAVKVNTLGTALLARVAIEANIARFVMISTDKAINPTNVMGATKRLAEIYLQSLSRSRNSVTKFMAVRFGNVLGSSGSVIPTFKRQIASGGPVRVTHPDVTRYFMTIPEAVGLVLQCGVLGKGSEIFVLDMGEPVKIVDLARNLIELSGLRPEEDIEIEFVGLRPGEKLFEELQHKSENVEETAHPKIMCLRSESLNFDEIKQSLDKLSEDLNSVDPGVIKTRLKTFVPEYRPFVQ